MAERDLRDHAVSGDHDFYDLLEIPQAASEAEVRRAYRKTALKYHPDKVGNNQPLLEKFHLLQIAYDVLSDSDLRQLYNNARRAREEKKEREAAYEGRRKKLKEELEAREAAGAAGSKRKREQTQEEEAFERELKRLAADGARRRKEREEQLRQELARQQADEQQTSVYSETPSTPAGVDTIDRTIKLRYPAGQLKEGELTSRFSRFGKIQHVVSKNKKIKLDGEKHRQEYTIAAIEFDSIVGAHAAVMDVPRLRKDKDPTGEESVWSIFENVNWASGKEPDCIPKPRTSVAKVAEGDSSKKVPSFGSFKGTPRASTAAGITSDEALMIRLKEAERKRMADKLRQEDAETDANNGQL